MAINMGTAVGYLDIDTTKFTKGFNAASLQMKSFFAEENTFSGRLQNLGGAMSSVGSTLTKTVTVAVAGAGAAIVKAGSDFEVAMSQIAATKNVSVDSLGAIEEKAIEMGSTTSFSATEAAEGLNILAMAGLSTEDSIKVIPDVLNLAAAGCLDMESAASYVTGAIKGFNDSMDNSQYYADLMAKGASLANTDVNMLGEALSNASSNALSYGQSVEDTEVALLRLAEQNVTGAEASNALSRAMADLYTPTDSAAKALNELGISAYDNAGKAKDINVVIDELNASLQGMTDEEANAYKSTIFTTYGLKAFNKMTVSSADKVQSFRDELSTASDTLSGMGSAYDMSQTQLDNLQGSVTLFKSALEGLEIRLYNLKNEGLKSIVDFATGVLDKLNSLDEATLEMIEKVALVAAAIGPVLVIGGKLVALVGETMDNFSLLSKALSGLKLSGVAGGFSTLIGTIGGLVAIIGTVAAVISAFKDAWEKNLNGIQDNTKNITDKVSGMFESFASAVKDIFNAIVDAWNSDWGGLKSTTEEVVATVIQFVSDMVDFISLCIEALRVAWDDNFLGMQDIVTNVFAVISKVISVFTDLVSGICETINQLLEGDFAGAWETLKTTFSNLLINVGNILNSLLSIIKQIFNNIVNVIESVLSKLVSKAKEKITEFANKIKEGAKSAVDKFVEYIKQLPEKAAYWFGYVIGKATLFVTQFPDKAKQAGQNFLNNLINFVKLLPAKVETWFVNTVNNAKSFATNFVNNAKQAGKNFVSGLVVNVKSAPSKIQSMATSMINAVKNLPSQFTSIGKNIVQGIINGIQSKVSSAISSVKNFGNNIMQGFKDALQIASPSKRAKTEVGEQIANGVIAGIDAKLKAGKIKAKEYADTLMDAAEQRLSNYQVYYDMSYKDEMDYWDKIRKQLKKGTQDRIDADAKYYEAKQNYYDAVKELDEQYLEDEQAIYDELNEKIEDLNKEYNDALTSRANAIMSAFNLFDAYEQKEAVSAQTLIDNLQTQKEALDLYTEQLNLLYTREVPDDMLDSIKDMGVDATQEIIAMNSMTDEQLQQYVLMWQQMNTEAQQQATIDLSGMKESTIQQIQELTKESKKELKALKASYKEELKALGTTGKKEATKSGKKVTKALADSVKAGSKEVLANVNSLSSSMISKFSAMASSIAAQAASIEASIAKINSAQSKVSGSHKAGLDYVPYDGYIAQLHKGEAVLTAQENKERETSSYGGGNNYYFYGTPPLDEKETARQIKKVQQQMAMGF